MSSSQSSDGTRRDLAASHVRDSAEFRLHLPKSKKRLKLRTKAGLRTPIMATLL